MGGAQFVGGAVGAGDVDLAGGGVESDVPLSFVDFDVVPAAQADELVDVGAAAEVPPDQVVGVGPGDGGLAAGPAAAAVSCV